MPPNQRIKCLDCGMEWYSKKEEKHPEKCPKCGRLTGRPIKRKERYVAKEEKA